MVMSHDSLLLYMNCSPIEHATSTYEYKPFKDFHNHFSVDKNTNSNYLQIPTLTVLFSIVLTKKFNLEFKNKIATIYSVINK
jgi:hypothetical protein